MFGAPCCLASFFRICYITINPFLLIFLLFHFLQSKLPGKKNDASVQGAEKKSTLPKESDDLSVGSDIPDDLNRKEKFKMVIGRAKREGQEQPSKESREEIGVRVDAAAAAAILQAARRGIKNPNLEILPRAELLNGEGSRASDSSQPLGGPIMTAIAETAAAVTASEADSSEAGLTKEQKLKAERLKRAKMFTAMLKSGAVASKAPPSELISGLDLEAEPSREREGSSVPPDSDVTERNERRLKRSYRSRNKKQDGDGEAEEEEEEENEDGEEDKERDHKHSRKKRRSHRSSNHSKERHKRHRKKHSSSSLKDKESRHRRHKHEDDSSGDGEDHGHSRHSRHGHEDDIDSASDGEDHRNRRRSRHGHEDDIYSSSDGGDHRHRRHRRRRKHGSSDDDIHGEDENHGRRSRRRHKRDSTDREDLEVGDDMAKLGEPKARSPTDRLNIREASVDASNSSRKASDTTEVPDDLRAKIRAMLMATL